MNDALENVNETSPLLDKQIYVNYIKRFLSNYRYKASL